MAEAFDIVVNNGMLFDGLGAPAQLRSVAIRAGKIAEISETPFPPTSAAEIIDATDCWITPGFIDFHTHYDVEVELAPSLSESLRHGVTVITMGSCSLSMAMGRPEDIADIFCRVEAVPRNIVLPLLEERKDWDSLPGYMEHLEGIKLGPHVTSFVGHSNIRMHTMGFDRSVDPKVRPSADELATMERLVHQGLDEGYLGVSIQTLPWDKLDGDRFRSRPLPSFYAKWSEYRRLTRILRDRERIFQGVPNVTTKLNVLLFLLESIGLLRKPLKTTIIALMDIRANRMIHRVVPMLSRICNRLLNADFRWQALPNVFDLWADGIDLVVFEEFGCGVEALHLTDPNERARLLQDPSYRKRFKRQWRSLFLPKAYHRDFLHTRVLDCPQKEYIDRSFHEIAASEGRHAVDVFLDLVAEHGDRLRWYSVMANDRRGPLEWIVSHPDVLIGFSDAGAHLRQMAHYNFPLRLLKLTRDAIQRKEPFMSIERAVHRLTGEIGEWFGLDAGVLQQGRRADLVVIDPEHLDESLDIAHEVEMPGFDGMNRLVRRNPATVRAVLVSGRRAVTDGEVLPEVGSERGFGSVLRVQH